MIKSTMGDIEDYQTKWSNTNTSFKRQFTIIDRLIGEAKACAVKLQDPQDRTEAKHARMMIDPIEHKLGLIKKYIDKLYELLPDAAPASEGGQWSVDALSVYRKQTWIDILLEIKNSEGSKMQLRSGS